MYRCNLNKDKEFIKEIKIDNKKRFRYNLITLVIFNALFLSSLIYMFALIHNAFAGVIAILLFLIILAGSVATLIKSRHSRKCILYRDKISIESTVFNGEIDLSKVYLVKPKKSIFDFIFKRSAHLLVIYSKDKAKEILLSFIGEDVDKLADDIMKLAIQARERNKNSSMGNVVKTFEESLITKKIKKK